MQTNRTVQYTCVELRRTVAIFQQIEWVSGIGDDQAEPIVLALRYATWPAAARNWRTARWTSSSRPAPCKLIALDG